MVYLHLFHGRKTVDEKLDDWGSDGPLLGPFNWLHTTYLSHFRGGTDADDNMEFRLIGDMIFYDGVYYGDWSVFGEETRQRDMMLPNPQLYSHTKAGI